MAATSDSPIQMPAKKFESDQKAHRSNNTAIEQFGNVSSYGFIPIGGAIWYAGSAAPPGFLECDGTAYSRENYAALFSVIGTTYGTGDGITTFNVPTRAQVVTAFGIASHTHGGVTAGAAATAAASSDGTGGIFIIRTGAF
jgi:hypothetical protein